MTLAPGSRLGPYEVSALIGQGGMGQVYRATDTNLGRQVAIKILPDTFAHDPERLARFEREAKTLASLNHPNVAIIHGLEKSDGHGQRLTDRNGSLSDPVRKRGPFDQFHHQRSNLCARSERPANTATLMRLANGTPIGVYEITGLLGGI